MQLQPLTGRFVRRLSVERAAGSAETLEVLPLIELGLDVNVILVREKMIELFLV